MRPLSDILDEIRAGLAESCAASGRDVSEVEIVAVTKTHGPETVREAWEHGLRIVGENKVQEAAWKEPLSVSGLEWHLIGHLQRNKVRHALQLFTCFHSVDSVQLIERIDSIADELGVNPRILMEVNVSGEASKSGMRSEDAPAALEAALGAKRLSVEGLMTMAPFAPDPEAARPHFARLRELRDRLERDFAVKLPRLSMGMTNDWRVAVEEGATWIRLGTALFGERPRNRIQRPVDAGDAGESGEGGGEFDRVLS